MVAIGILKCSAQLHGNKGYETAFLFCQISG